MTRIPSTDNQYDAASTAARDIATDDVSVAWGAIFAGAVAAAALSLILLLLGTGLGLSSISPWANKGVEASTFGLSTILWITLTSVLASGLGGYLAGRLRHRALQPHRDEVYFRDTAHGLLAWSVATLATATLLTSAIGMIVGGGAKAGGSLIEGAASTSMAIAEGGMSTSNERSTDYSVDALFRGDSGERAADAASVTSEVSRIFVRTLNEGDMAQSDVEYIGSLIADRTNLTQSAAEARVNTIYADLQTRIAEAEAAVKVTADEARKASAYSALWLFVSLLVGAFIASFAATIGGRQRDA